MLLALSAPAVRVTVGNDLVVDRSSHRAEFSL